MYLTSVKNLVLLSFVFLWPFSLSEPLQADEFKCEEPPQMFWIMMSEVFQNKNIEDIKWVKSSNREFFYLVTVKIENDPRIYTFAASQSWAKTGYGMTFSMDDTTFEATGFGDARTLREPLYQSDRGLIQAKKCLSDSDEY